MSFREDGHAAVDWVADYLERVGELPVLPPVEPGALLAALPAEAPERPEPFEAVLRDLDALVLPATTHWQHPRFFAYFAATAAGPGILAELVAAALNNVAFVWRTSPAATELELGALRWVAGLLGLPPGWHGHIEDTASISTLGALFVARETTGRRVVVASEEAHSSVERAARMLAMELRAVPADDEFRLDLSRLDVADAAAVVATVGSTSTASVDPVPALADAAASVGAWLHVDAAYAGSAMVCPEHRWAFAGVERADSLVVNAHKWLSVPMDCSLLWTSRPDDFRRAYGVAPVYLRTAEAAPNLSDYGPALGRRFRALKLWAVLRCLGREGLQAGIREHVRLAGEFARWVEAEPGWELAAPPRFSLVCFRRAAPDEENRRILDAVNASGEAFLSSTVLGGRVALRLAIGNLRTTEDDVRRAWDALRAAAA
ncbi:MAG TPA: aminotransferase class V-fold PLP-dependent enzyme [Gaiellaceae bacterium]|nr:aminotransferase class V-fold PLP-dependent enzyme [Gaiellaceae bacterium]